MHNKADYLLILRGLACLAVLIWHIEPPKQYLFYQGINFSWITFPSGMAAVWIFFLLSGYFMGKIFFIGKYTLTSTKLRLFYLNRIKRIFPLYYFNVFILSLVVYPGFWISNKSVFLNILTFRVNNFWTIMNFNANLWAISTEVQFYLFVPVIFLVLRKFLKYSYSSKIILGILILLSGSAIRYFIAHRYGITNSTTYSTYIYTPLFSNIDFFIFGFFINLINAELSGIQSRLSNLLQRCRLYMKTITVLLLTVLYLYSSYSSTFFFQQFDKYSLHILYLLPVMTSLIIGICIIFFEYEMYHTLNYKNREKLSLSSIIRNPVRFFEIFGILSLGIYIWHRPVIDVMHLMNFDQSRWIPFLQKLGITFFITMGISIFTYICIEKPFLSHRNKYYKNG